MRRWFWLLLILLGLAYLATGFARVEYDERAVVRRFGRVVARPGPGLWFGMPWGFDQIDKVKVSTARQVIVGYNPEESNDAPGATPGQFLTGDQNLVNLKLVVEYAVDDRDGELEQFLAQQANSTQLLSRECEALAAEWIGARSVDRVLGGRAALVQFLTERLRTKLEPLRLGILVQRINVDFLAAPEEVREAFESVNQAQNAVQTRKNQAEQEKQRLLNDAETFRNRALNEASAYRSEKLAAANSEAEAFLIRLAQFIKLKASDPEFLTRIWREEVGKILANVKERGRIELLDDALGPNGLELNQFVPTKRK